ncbi:LPD38 domain-containing protein [Vibrio jasicida]|uniref:LPD38 domain-containing protein n=1 Tax=Vibrio jasicida TaxID=766224 RepID=UPI0005EDBC0E|nr:LPD38 domain-containing protein [Vibrio jasicida]
MAKYTPEQLQQFVKDNDEVLTLVRDAGIGLDQLKEGALNMSAFDPSWGQTLKAGGKAAVAGFKKQGLGLARSTVEGAIDQGEKMTYASLPDQVISSAQTLARGFLGKDTLQEISDKLATDDANVSKKLADEMPYIDDPNTAKAIAIDAIGGMLPSVATGLGAALLTRNPMAAGAAVGAGSYGSHYGTSRDVKGLTPEESRSRAADLALMEGATSALPFAGALGKLGGSIPARIAGTALSEGAQESAMVVGEESYDKLMYNEALPEDLLAQTGRAFLVGALGGGVMGVGGVMINPNPQVESSEQSSLESVDLNPQTRAPQPDLDTPTFMRDGVTLTELQTPPVTQPTVNENEPDPYAPPKSFYVDRYVENLNQQVSANTLTGKKKAQVKIDTLEKQIEKLNQKRVSEVAELWAKTGVVKGDERHQAEQKANDINQKYSSAIDELEKQQDNLTKQLDQYDNAKLAQAELTKLNALSPDEQYDYIQQQTNAQDLTAPTEQTLESSTIEEAAPLTQETQLEAQDLPLTEPQKLGVTEVQEQLEPNSSGTTEGQELSEAESLLTTEDQKQSVTDSSKAATGKPHVVYTPDNEKVDTAIKIVDASELQASHDIDGNKNPNYPQALQPRDRSKPTLVNKTKKLAKDLNPERLDISKDIVTGAPIIKDNIVESGNGRTIAITEAYRKGNAQQYKQYLIDNADKYGIDPQQIEAMPNPVLVLERQGEMSEVQRQAFTKKANRDVGVSMSPVEQAKSDAQLLTDDDLLEINIGETGDMNAASNHAFLSRFAQRLGDEEAAQYVGENNRWNTDMGKRALAAVFQKAYDDKSLTTNAFEDVNPDTKRVMSALARASGHIAKLKGDKGGDHGLGQAIAEAANVVRAAGQKGQSATEYLSQLDMYDQPSPIALDMAQLFAENATSTKRMGDVLVSLAKQLENENQKAQSGSLFEDTGTPPLSELIKANKDYQDATTKQTQVNQEQGDLIGSNPPRISQPPDESRAGNESSRQRRAETDTTEVVGENATKSLIPIDQIKHEQIAAIAKGSGRIERINQLTSAGYSKEEAIKLNARLERKRQRDLTNKRKPKATLEPLKEQPQSAALMHTSIRLAGKASPTYLAARKLAADIENMMVEGVSFHDAYRYFTNMSSAGKTPFDEAYKELTGRLPSQPMMDKRKEVKLDSIKSLGDAIHSIKTGSDMVNWLAKHASSPVNRRIAERIAPLVGANVAINNIGFHNGEAPTPDMLKRHGAYQRYDSGKERIVLWNEGEVNAANESTVLHELLHAATAKALAAEKAATTPTPLTPIVKELDQLREAVSEHIAQRQIKKQLTTLEKSREGQYVLGQSVNNENPSVRNDEFISWGLTDHTLQNILANIKLTPKKSAWNRFVSSIGQLLGLKPTDNTALGRLLETTDKLLTVMEKEQAHYADLNLGQGVDQRGEQLTPEQRQRLYDKFNPDPVESSMKAAYRKVVDSKMVKRAKELQAQGFGTATSNITTAIRNKFADKYEPFRKVDEQLYGDNLLHSTTLRGWALSKSSNAAQGALYAMLDYGRIRYNTNQKLIEVMEDANTGGLKGVLSQLDEKGELDEFFMWMAANRAQQINERSLIAESKIANLKAEKKNLIAMRHSPDLGPRQRDSVEKAIRDTESQIKAEQKKADVKERFLSEEDIRDAMLLNRQTRKDGSSRAPLFDKVLKEFNQYRSDVLKIAEETGVVSSENRAMWEDEFYVPFYRVMDEETPSGQAATGGLSRQDVIKKLKGSEKGLGDLLNNSLMNMHFLLNASLKNRAAEQALDNAVQIGIAEKTTEYKRDKNASTYIMVDGKKEWYNVSDPEYLAALMSMGNFKFEGIFKHIVDIGSAVKGKFTVYVTAVPNFIIKNFIRDSILAPAFSKVDGRKGGVIKGARLWGAGEMNKVRADMLASGAAFEFGFSHDDTKKQLDSKLKSKVVSYKRFGAIFGSALNGYHKVQGLAENANRAAVYDANLEKGKLAASIEAMDLMDFGAGGSSPTVNFLNAIVPFLNVAIQGVDKVSRSSAQVYKAMKGEASLETRAQAVRFASYTGTLAAASVYLALQNSDDEEYQELPSHAKNTNWFIRTGGEKGEYILVPKPQGIGLVINLAERGTDGFTGVIKTKDTLDYVKETVFDTFMMNPTPQIVKPIIELYMNHNMFTGQAIESMRDERYSKSERYDYNTSEVAKLLGNDALSPKQIDHLIRAYFSSVGEIVSEGINMAVDAASENKRPAKYWWEYTPLYKDLSSPTFTRSQQRFYEIYGDYVEAKNDYKRAVELGDKIKAGEILKESEIKIKLVPTLDKYKRKMSKIAKNIEIIRSNKNLSADEKRSYIDTYNRLKAETYSDVMDKVDETVALYEKQKSG